MFLFLDVVSPIPEFHIIDDKKIIYSVKIIDNADQKLSDHIIPTYLKINNVYKLSKNIKKLIITIGPGSYTALRVGSSFIAGLSYSMNLPVSVISTETIYKYLNYPNLQIGIYFESSNNQKFFSYKKDLDFYHHKIENNKYSIPEFVSLVFFNLNIPKFIDNKIKLEAFSLKQIIINNLNLLEFSKDEIIKPIYISNNSILN